MNETPPPLPQDPPVPVINYDTPHPDQVSRRRYVGVLVAAAVMGAALLALLLIRFVQPRVVATPAPVKVAMPPSPTVLQIQMQARRAAEAAQKQFAQQRLDQLLASERSASSVVYEEDAARAGRLKAQSGMQEAGRSGISQPVWGAFQPPVFALAPYQDQRETANGLLFAHERVSPSGNRRLVLMEIAVGLDAENGKNGEADIKLQRQLKYRICETTLRGTAPSVLRSGQSLTISHSAGGEVIPVRWVDGSLRAARPAEHNLTFFAGQVDRNDASHFTIDYQLAGKRNTIDVFLSDDDFLRVIPRGGNVEGGTWTIDH